jgi:hypothetical protein
MDSLEFSLSSVDVLISLELNELLNSSSYLRSVDCLSLIAGRSP